MSEIKQYIRRNRNGKKRTKVGLFLARRVNGVPNVLWSLCKKDDKFDLNEAVRVAENQLHPVDRKVPPGIKKDYDRFVSRAERYFKTSVTSSN